MVSEICELCCRGTEVLPVDYKGRGYICSGCADRLTAQLGEHYLSDYINCCKEDFLLNYFKPGRYLPPYDKAWWTNTLEAALLRYDEENPGAFHNLKLDYAENNPFEFRDYVLKREGDFI